MVLYWTSLQLEISLFNAVDSFVYTTVFDFFGFSISK